VRGGQADKLKGEKEMCSNTLSERQEEHSRLQAKRDVMKKEQDERAKLASSIADKYDLDQNLVVGCRLYLHLLCRIHRHPPGSSCPALQEYV
jgi:hypothetical protein